ncbi:MAG: hypothetical protein RLZZ598_1030 [Pseudomonadota bacterium]
MKNTRIDPMLRRAGAAGLLLAAALLGGCGGVSTLEVTVSSQGQWPAERKPATYAFERLPSQQLDLSTQELAEAAARPAIERLGFRPAPAAEAELLVQVGTRIAQAWQQNPSWNAGAAWYGGWRGPYWGPMWGPAWGVGLAGSPSDRPDYLLETGVLFREPKAMTPIYESRGRLISRSGNSRFFAPMFEASLRDFPGPALSPRSVTVMLAP